MTTSGNNVGITLDSLQLVSYSLQAPCCLCGHGNAYNADQCRNCFAPMSLSEQAALDKVTPSLVAIVGTQGSGRSVYTGMLLDILGRGHALSIASRGAHAQSVQHGVTTALSQQRFPPSDALPRHRWDWIHLRLAAARKEKPVDLLSPDLPGEALLEEIDQPGRFPGLQSYFAQCGGLLLLIDSTRLLQGQQDQEFFAIKTLSWLLGQNAGQRAVWAQRPVAIIYTKADLFEEAWLDPLRFTQRNLPGLAKTVRERFRQAQFFAASVVGASAFLDLAGRGQERIPLRIEPRGIVEPFAWVVEQIRG